MIAIPSHLPRGIAETDAFGPLPILAPRVPRHLHRIGQMGAFDAVAGVITVQDREMRQRLVKHRIVDRGTHAAQPARRGMGMAAEPPTGWQQAYVSRYETGERMLAVDEYVAVARAIGIDPVALLARILVHEENGPK